MPSHLDCPACGADIEYVEDQDRLHCDFCGTELRVDREGEEPRLRVLSQPEPQVDVMTEQAHQELAEDFDSDLFGEPVVPGVAVPPVETASRGAVAYPSMLPETTPAPGAFTEPAPYPAGQPAVGGSGSGSTWRWVAIGVGIFILACVLLACIVGVLLLSNFMVF